MRDRTTWAGVIVFTVIGLSVFSIWWQLRGPAPDDHGLAEIAREQPALESEVRCLIDSIEADPDRFYVDNNFYLEPGRGTTFRLRDRASNFTVELSTGRTLMYLNRFGSPLSVNYGC